MKTISRITDSIFARAQGKTVLAWAIPTLGIYFTMLLWTIPELERLSGGMDILDLRPLGYTPEYVRTLFESLGETGRDFYLYRQIPLDLLYPGLFALTGALLLAWLCRKTLTNSSKWQWLVLTPLFAGLCDYLENIGTIVMLWSHPDLSAATIASVFTILKSLLSTVFFVMALAGFVAALVSRLRSRRATV